MDEETLHLFSGAWTWTTALQRLEEGIDTPEGHTIGTYLRLALRNARALGTAAACWQSMAQQQYKGRVALNWLIDQVLATEVPLCTMMPAMQASHEDKLCDWGTREQGLSYWSIQALLQMASNAEGVEVLVASGGLQRLVVHVVEQPSSSNHVLHLLRLVASTDPRALQAFAPQLAAAGRGSSSRGLLAQLLQQLAITSSSACYSPGSSQT